MKDGDRLFQLNVKNPQRKTQIYHSYISNSECVSRCLFLVLAERERDPSGGGEETRLRYFEYDGLCK